MHLSRVRESRALDHVYDTTYTAPYVDNGRRGPLYRPAVPADAHGGDVMGANRTKFFRRPMVPHLTSVAPEILWAPTSKTDPLVPPEAVPEPKVKEVSVQTKFRESEAQTDPYTPEFHVAENKPEPEVLLLESLTYEHGLPVGMREIHMIEYAREKRRLEESLPPFTDEASLFLRKRLMEVQEMREFDLRNQELDNAREQRIGMLRKAILDRDQGNEFLAEQRIEALRQRKLEERDSKLAKIQAKRVKVLRKLTKQRAQLRMPGDLEPATRRDIIGDYADFDSEVYAPATRLGKHPDKQAQKFDVAVRIAPVAPLEGLNTLEATLPLKLTSNSVPKAKPTSKKPRSTEERKTLSLQADLERSQTILAQQKQDALLRKTQGITGKGKLKLDSSMPAWRTKVLRADRPTTPIIQRQEGDEDEEREEVLAILLLQRLLRGRAIQNTMFEGKERRKHLITELRAEAEQDAREMARPSSAERRAALITATADTAAGESVASILDLLAKELVRKEEKTRLKALAAQANELRRMREAQEAGTRQAEEILRRKEDEVFRQVARAHHGAAMHFVEETMRESIDATAGAQAMFELQSLPNLRAVIEQTRKSEEEEEHAIRNLVASFLIPGVERLQMQKQVRLEERRFVDAAQKSIKQSLEVLAERNIE